MSTTATIDADDPSIGLFYAYTPGGGEATYLLRKLRVFGNSLIVRCDFGFTGSVAYRVDGHDYFVSDPGFGNNVPTEIYTHGESDAYHDVEFYTANIHNAGAFTASSDIGVASFGKTQDWGEFAVLTTTPADSTGLNLPSYVTDDEGGQAFSYNATYGFMNLASGGSIRWHGTGTCINVLARAALQGAFALFSDGIMIATIETFFEGWETDAHLLQPLITGLDPGPHEYCLYSLGTNISITAIQMGNATATGSFDHTPAFAARQKVLILGDSTSTAFGLQDFRDVWAWLVFGVNYWVTTMAAIGGTSLHDYTADGPPKNTDPLFTTSSAEYLTNHKYVNFIGIAYNLVIVSDGANDICLPIAWTASGISITDNFVGFQNDAAIIWQEGMAASTYDGSLSDIVFYGNTTYPGQTILAGTRATGVTTLDGIHPDEAGMITIANHFYAEFPQFFTPPASTSATVLAHGEVTSTADDHEYLNVAAVADWDQSQPWTLHVTLTMPTGSGEIGWQVVPVDLDDSSIPTSFEFVYDMDTGLYEITTGSDGGNVAATPDVEHTIHWAWDGLQLTATLDNDPTPIATSAETFPVPVTPGILIRLQTPSFAENVPTLNRIRVTVP